MSPNQMNEQMKAEIRRQAIRNVAIFVTIKIGVAVAIGVMAHQARKAMMNPE